MFSSQTTRRWHRRIGLVFSLVVLAAAGSGLLHTLMSMSQPPPPPPAPSRLGAVVATARITPAEAVAKAAPRQPSALRTCALVELDGRLLYRLRFADDASPCYVDADTSEVCPDADDRLAARIASTYLGGKSVRKTARLTAYDDEYIAIFRTLPVTRYDADDARHTRLYVSTDTGSVTRATNDRQQWEANTFGLLHKYAFVHHRGWRNALQIVAMGGVCVVALTGIALWYATRPKRATSR